MTVDFTDSPVCVFRKREHGNISAADMKLGRGLGAVHVVGPVFRTRNEARAFLNEHGEQGATYVLVPYVAS